MLGLKGGIYFSETTLILYQAWAGEGGGGGSAFLSKQKLGLLDLTS